LFIAHRYVQPTDLTRRLNKFS